jgi:diguanylate cyclase (GGDEF)-like protein
MIWNGARLFDGHKNSPVGIFGGAVAWLLAARLTNFTAGVHEPVIFSSMIVAAYAFATAAEFWRGRHENLVSRLPLVVMLSMHGALYLLRVPLALFIPGSRSEVLFSTAWFGVIGLESLLYMIATAFILLALAKERVELQHKVAASVDPLTGIANRRAFLEEAVRSLGERVRHPQPVSALLFDLDRFKSINDQYGHAVGDRVLRVFADIAAVELRRTDLLGRLGGEEFGAVLFGAEAGSALATAERIRNAFAASQPSGKDRNGISVSVGVATIAADEPAEIETLLTRADEALYVAKARGRNRVEIADGYLGRGRERARDPATVLPTAFVASPGIMPSDVTLSDVLQGKPTVASGT